MACASIGMVWAAQAAQAERLFCVQV